MTDLKPVTNVGGRRKALGRGLGALIPGAPTQRELFHCPVENIVAAPDQPRTVINPHTLRELADSIAASGVLQPVLLRRVGSRYKLIAGERRWRAARMAGLKKIPALVKDIDEDDVFALALIENVQREDLTPLEEALAYRRLIDEYGYTQKTLAEKLGKGRSTVANTLRLLDLPAEVREQVISGELTAGHARAVLSLPSDERAQFAHGLAKDGVSVREAEARVHKRRAEPARQPRKTSKAKDQRQINLAFLERRLQEALHARVRISDQGGSGRVELFYDDDDMLQAIVDNLLG